MQSHLWDIVNIFLKVDSKCYILATYVIVEIPQDESFVYCTTFANVDNKFSTLIILVSNCMVSFGNLLIISVFELYIVQCRLGVKTCILINIQ